MLINEKLEIKYNDNGLFHQDTIDNLHKYKLLRIWVPKAYNGLGLSFEEGLSVLFDLAKIDGSLGWMVTLCSGANYFSRNLLPEVATRLFTNPFTCLGGSGMIGGKAEKVNGGYIISGNWKYATGAPYISHFTINGIIYNNGIEVLHEDGTQVIRSFILSRDQVNILEDWRSMGMKATGTYSFEVKNVFVPQDYSFVYNEFYTHSLLDAIPFRIFADLTLLVNYVGMANHFILEANNLKPNISSKTIYAKVIETRDCIYGYAAEVERLLISKCNLDSIQLEIHSYGINSINEIIVELVNLYTQLGIIASHDNEPINTIFKDFFTATQHANFRYLSL